MEQNLDLVLYGLALKDLKYKKEKKEKELVPGIVVDHFKIKGDLVELYEVKKSKKFYKAHEMQLKYYLYVLKKAEIKAKGFLLYPLVKKKFEFVLDEKDEKELEEIAIQIRKVISLNKPPTAMKNSLCKTCAYNELCWCDI